MVTRGKMKPGQGLGTDRSPSLGTKRFDRGLASAFPVTQETPDEVGRQTAWGSGSSTKGTKNTKAYGQIRSADWQAAVSPNVIRGTAGLCGASTDLQSSMGLPPPACPARTRRVGDRHSDCICVHRKSGAGERAVQEAGVTATPPRRHPILRARRRRIR